MTTRKSHSQLVPHITLVGADRQTSVDFWEGALGMPFVFEQPSLDRPEENRLYFDRGDGRLIAITTNGQRRLDSEPIATGAGAVHHVAFSLSNATFCQAVERLDERGIKHSGVKDRGFMESIYFQGPRGLLVELASYRFELPAGSTHADVLHAAHRIRAQRDNCHIDPMCLTDAIEQLMSESRASLSAERR